MKPSLIAGVCENTSESIALVVVDVTIEDDPSLQFELKSVNIRSVRDLYYLDPDRSAVGH